MCCYDANQLRLKHPNPNSYSVEMLITEALNPFDLHIRKTVYPPAAAAGDICSNCVAGLMFDYVCERRAKLVASLPMWQVVRYSGG